MRPILFVSALALISSASSSAGWAQQSPVAPGGCEQTERLVCARGGAASVVGAQGSVMTWVGAGYQQLQAGAILSPGASVLTRNGSAQVRLSDACMAMVPQNTRANVTQVGDKLCVEREAAIPLNQYRAQTSNNDDNTLLYVVVGGGILAGGAAALALSNNGSKTPSASP